MDILERAQCRAARGLLDWTQSQLAEAAGISLPTLRRFENGAATPIPNNIAAIRRALERAGVEFIPTGVRRLTTNYDKTFERTVGTHNTRADDSPIRNKTLKSKRRKRLKN